jgi:hypothetical protein
MTLRFFISSPCHLVISSHMMPLLDQWMPAYDVTARYHIDIHASASLVYQALLDTEFGRLPVVRLLMFLRAIPALFTSPRATVARMRHAGEGPSLRLKSVLRDDFVLLAEQPGSEIVLGLTGRFWAPSGGLIPTDPTTFHSPPPGGMARAAWNFEVTALTPGESRLATETRVRCGDPATAREFRRYWRLVAPGSGLIRWAILRRVRRAAEGAAAG